MQNEGGCMGAVPLMSAQRILNRNGGRGGGGGGGLDRRKFGMPKIGTMYCYLGTFKYMRMVFFR